MEIIGCLIIVHLAFPLFAQCLEADAHLCFGIYRFPIVEPDPGHTKLRLAREGLEAIERITTPIAAVAVSLRFMPLSIYIQPLFSNVIRVKEAACLGLILFPFAPIRGLDFSISSKFASTVFIKSYYIMKSIFIIPHHRNLALTHY